MMFGSIYQMGGFARMAYDDMGCAVALHMGLLKRQGHDGEALVRPSELEPKA